MEPKKAAATCSVAEIERICRQIRPGGLWVPVRPETSPASATGPRLGVFRLYSEMGLEPTDPELAYWEALQAANVTDGIGEFSWISGNLSQARAADEAFHWHMVRRFVAPDLLPRITNRDLQGAASIVFNRIGCLLAIRHLMLFGGTSPQKWNVYSVGRLALLANDFVQNTRNPKTPTASSLDIVLLVAPTWDVYNIRNLGHTISRMLTILTEVLPGSDPLVSTLVSQLGTTAAEIEINGIPLNQFVAIVFGLFAYAGPQNNPVRVLFNSKEIFAQTDIPQDLLEKFLDARAPTIDKFRILLAGEKAISRSSFSDELKLRPFLIDSLNVFRTYPFLRLDSERVLILDVQFVAELLTSGVYWSIHDGLPKEKRETFKQLWGRMFEIYTVNLLAEFYPPMSSILSFDLRYGNGQIDALLDFGYYVLLIEIKSSLLTEPAKRNSDKKSFLDDFRRKFIENERGKPKAIKQLAAATRAILAGVVSTAKKDEAPIIYPIFVSDEPAIEATFMNAFFNEEFQKEGLGDPRVKPITTMSIDELEQILSHVAENDFRWEELLNSRFNEFGVYPNSVGQAIHDLILVKGLTAKQNPALKRKYDEFGSTIRAVYKKLQ